MKLTVGYLYPNLLNLYGDTGNVKCLQKRLQWRGMEGEVCLFSGGSAIDFQKVDLVLLGGGSDREQEIACRYLKGIGGRLRDFIESGGGIACSLRWISAVGELLPHPKYDDRGSGNS